MQDTDAYLDNLILLRGLRLASFSFPFIEETLLLFSIWMMAILVSRRQKNRYRKKRPLRYLQAVMSQRHSLVNGRLLGTCGEDYLFSFWQDKWPSELLKVIHWKNTLQQLHRVGPKSVGVCLLTSAFVGMAFAIQFIQEFTGLGLNRSIGGVLALAFSRELSPVLASIVVAGLIGSAFAAELGTMQVSEQTDSLRVLGANPIDYLVTPRVIETCIALPFLTLMCFTVGVASSVFLADGIYGISIIIILDSAQRSLKSLDIISAMIKSQVFAAIISIVNCAWGVTTSGGAKGVGESTTSAVVISLSGFVLPILLSYFFFQGAGDSLKKMYVRSNSSSSYLCFI